ncbi:MAG: hypothetical protein ATN32_01680 [Candidatus Epulonipiscium fishelsonii]|nr:MAG: hypothetical protein ATN32_01680 [Epulopiscium sp. AS2M-Bin002]
MTLFTDKPTMQCSAFDRSPSLSHVMPQLLEMKQSRMDQCVNPVSYITDGVSEQTADPQKAADASCDLQISSSQRNITADMID